MQNPDKENMGEEQESESADGARAMDNELEFTEQAQAGAMAPGVDPPIIVDGGQ
jgi:hypothetical protein